MPTIFDNQPQPPTHAPSHPDHDAITSVDKLIRRKSQSMGLFQAFAIHPTGITFTNQEPDEMILLFLRRHFITNVPWIFTTMLLMIIPPLLFVGISFLPMVSLPTGLTIIITGFYYLIALGYAFSKFISWFYNIGVVTQKRLIDLDTANILAHNSTTANFNEIVDVTFHQKGFFQSSFDYGNIRIQTEALHANFEFDACPKPTEVVDIISDLRVATKGHH